MSEDKVAYGSEASLPEGYMQDALGRLVPVAQVKERDRLCDDVVRALFDEVDLVARKVDEFKTRAFGELDAFAALSNEKYGVKLGGGKGNVTLTSFDGSMKIVLAIDQSIVFGEQFQAAKVLIDECIREWINGSRPELCALVNDACRVDKAGNISSARVLGLLRLDIQDEKWRRAMEAITDSIQVTRTKRYVRFYRRTAAGDGYEQIPLG